MRVQNKIFPTEISTIFEPSSSQERLFILVMRTSLLLGMSNSSI
jgi:hypothetical protein